MEIQKVNTLEIQSKLCDRLEDSGWKAKLKTFVLSEDFKRILDHLLEERQNGKHFTPKIKQLFRAFEECPYNNLKVVFVGQDPYSTLFNGINAADGIAFSCSNTGTVQPSLKYMFQEIEKQIYPEGGYSWDPDLKRWANQGVLLLNSALTVQVGKTGTHYEIWKNFVIFVLDHLNWFWPGMIYVFLGR